MNDRLADRLARHDLGAPKYTADDRMEALAADIVRPMLAAISTAVVIDLTDTTDYLYAGGVDRSFNARDFPVLLPTYPVMFLETRRPAADSAQNGGQELLPYRWGAFVLAEALGAGDAAELQLEPESAYAFSLDLFTQQNRQSLPIGPSLSALIGADATGEPTGSPVYHFVGVDSEADFEARAGVPGDDLLALFEPCLPALLFGLTLMNVKGTRVLAERTPAALARARERRDRRRGLSLAGSRITYHVLDVRPAREIIDAERRASGEVAVPRALHAVRGHVKDYRERGLFGRHRGAFWFGPSLRGSPSRGLRIKDYRVLRPAARPPAPPQPPSALD